MWKCYESTRMLPKCPGNTNTEKQKAGGMKKARQRGKEIT